MEKIELIQRIGDDVCEGCGPDADCGIDPSECERINNAEAVLDEYVDAEISKRKATMS